MKYEYIVQEEIVDSIEEVQQIISDKTNDETEIVRPNISVWHDIAAVSIRTVLAVGILILLYFLSIPKYLFAAFLVLTAIILIILNAKKFIISAIILYQKYAPKKIRSACLFKPCCSEYMKISIEKYGVLKGFIRGIKRIMRCHYPNGGVDEP